MKIGVQAGCPGALRDHWTEATTASVGEHRISLDQLAELLNDVVYVVDIGAGPHGLFFSGGLLQMLGFEPELLQSGLVDATELVHPDDRDRVGAAFVAAVRGGTSSVEVRLLAADGEWRWSEHRIGPLRDPGRPAAVLGVARDIDERRRTQDRVAEARKHEAVRRMAGGVAHDFNNLLTGILGFAELALLRTPEDAPEREDLVEVVRTGERARHLVGSLLALSRQDAGELNQVEVNDLIAESRPLLARMVGEQVALEVGLGSGPLIVQGNSTLLQQVIVNLAVNARDAMPAGGRLQISTDRVRLEAGQRDGQTEHDCPSGLYVRVSVIDTGGGMDAYTLARALDPFFTTKCPGRGTGLGLASCDGQIRQMGGSFHLHSEPGAGTMCRFYLPLVDIDRPATPVEWTPRSSKRCDETILLVEDDADVRAVTTRLLIGHGYQVIGFADPVCALAHLGGGGRADLILADVALPEMSGPALIRELRWQGAVTPVLFVSGFDECDIADQLPVEGYRFLHKPFRPVELLQAVRTALDASSPSYAR